MDNDIRSRLRFWAFISYSHADARIAKWLHGAVEGFRVPRRLVGKVGSEGPIPRRLLPVFIDRNELAASGSLATELQAALEASRFLIVVCTPATSRSPWVDEEIRRFKLLHGEDRVLAVIVAGEPGASATPGIEAQECFPPSLRYTIGPDGLRTGKQAEPLAADLRPGGDGKRLALLKLIATLAGTRLDDLVRREAHRRARRLTLVAFTSLIGMATTGALALYADHQRRQAERQSVTANAAVDYLVGVFDIVDSGNENPNTVTAATLLRRSASKAEKTLAGQPLIRARIADTIGRVYNNLGLYRDSEAILTRAQPLLGSLGGDGASGLLTLASTRLNLGDLKGAAAIVQNVRSNFSVYPPTLIVRARAARTSGDIRASAADQEGAVKDYAEAEADYREAPDATPQMIADVVASRGVLLTDMTRFVEAERALLTANAIYRKALGDKHRLTGISYNALAYNEFSAKNFTLAATNIAKAQTIFETVLDSSNPTLAGALSLRGQIEQQAGHLTAAKAALDRAIAIYHSRFGAHHYLIGMSLVYRALVDADLGDTTAAFADFDEAKVNYDIGYGRVHANHGDLLVNRATVLAKAGRFAEAHADCTNGLKILGETLGPTAGYTVQMSAICAALPRQSVDQVTHVDRR